MTSLKLIRISLDKFQRYVSVSALVVFNWVLFGLAIFAVVLVYDPLGSRKYSDLQESPSTGESIKHRKSTSLWQRRFRWAFCWVSSIKNNLLVVNFH